MSSFTLQVNGATADVDAAPATPLIYVLRDQLGLNSPRYGCGAELCGACRIMLDGKLAYACTATVEDAHSKEITTVEGLGNPSQLHPIQQAFLEFNAAQCGYCASGIIMAVAALLNTNANPGRDDIRQALKDNLCRCGAHNRIIKAVSRAAELLRQQSAATAKP